MKKKYLMLLLFVQVLLVSIASGQVIGVGTSTVSGFPLSTLDIGGTLGITLVQNIGTAQTSVQIENSTVLYTATNGQITLSLPAASATYLHRIYILSYSAGNKTSMTISPSYYDLTHTLNSLLLFGKSIMVICNGTNWLQII